MKTHTDKERKREIVNESLIHDYEHTSYRIDVVCFVAIVADTAPSSVAAFDRQTNGRRTYRAHPWQVGRTDGHQPATSSTPSSGFMVWFEIILLVRTQLSVLYNIIKVLKPKIAHSNCRTFASEIRFKPKCKSQSQSQILAWL